MSGLNAAASLPIRLNDIAGNSFAANSVFFQLKIWCTTTGIPWSFVTNWALRVVAVLTYIICEVLSLSFH